MANKNTIQLSPSLTEFDMENLNKGQKIMTRMLKIFTEICDKHNIKYALCGGNLIGAHYYKGWVPWDGDVDIMVYKNDYEKLRKILNSELPDDMWYQNRFIDKHYKSTIDKIRYKYAYYQHSDKYKWHGGLQIDIVTFEIKNDIFVPQLHVDLCALGKNITKADVFPMHTVEFDGLKVATFNNYVKFLLYRYHKDKTELPLFGHETIPVNSRYPHEGLIIFGVPEFHTKLYPNLYQNRT